MISSANNNRINEEMLSAWKVSRKSVTWLITRILGASDINKTADEPVRVVNIDLYLFHQTSMPPLIVVLL